MAQVSMNILRKYLIFLILAVSSQTVSAEELKTSDLDKNVIWGKIIARDNCAQCHAVGLEGDSPNKKAPQFWRMSSIRDVNEISEMLFKQAGPKHSDMPSFRITKRQSDQIAAWINWIQPLAHGKRLAETNCARCHGITQKDGSRHPDAPPFRTLSQNYPVDALEESFAEGIVTGHLDMPLFVMTELQLTDLIAYFETIQD